jgi:serine/threonine-protein kinase RsbW
MSAYYEEAGRRRQQDEYKDRKIHVTARETHDEVTYIIRDEGDGFDPGSLPDPTSPEAMERLHGRGLLLIGTFMDRVQHNDRGNEIAMVKHSTRDLQGDG